MSLSPVPHGRTQCHSFISLHSSCFRTSHLKTSSGTQFACGQGQAFCRLTGCQQKESPGTRGCEEQLFHQSALHWKAVQKAEWLSHSWKIPGESFPLSTTPKEAFNMNGKNLTSLFTLIQPPGPSLWTYSICFLESTFPLIGKNSNLVSELSSRSIFSRWLWTAKNNPKIMNNILIWAEDQMLVRLWDPAVTSVTSYSLSSIQEHYIQESCPHKCDIRDGVKYSLL